MVEPGEDVRKQLGFNALRFRRKKTNQAARSENATVLPHASTFNPAFVTQ
jgi:hypothetical protein